MDTHGAVVELHKGDGYDEHEGEQGVEVIGYGPDEELYAAEARVQVCGHAGDGGGPGGDGGYHAHGGGGSVDEVGELGPGDAVAVGDGAHDGAHGEAVEVVVDEDEHAQHKGGQGGAHPGLDVLLGPASKGGGTAGAVDHGDDYSQNDQEQKNTRIIRNGSDKAGVEGGVQRGYRGKIRAEEGAHQHTDEQGGVGLLGDKGQDYGQDGGHQGPESTVHLMYLQKISDYI